jgi:predicted protein tyrosine phosphatase
MTLIVCPLRYVEAVVADRGPSHLVTLLGPNELSIAPAGFEPARHLKLGVDDIAAPMEGMTAPSAAMVERLLEFGESWNDRAAPMVVHCWAGVSRSTAAAFALACARSPHADEAAIAQALRQAAPHAYPNRRIVALADDILDRRGRMLEAVIAIGGNAFTPEGVPFDLAARH